MPETSRNRDYSIGYPWAPLPEGVVRSELYESSSDSPWVVRAVCRVLGHIRLGAYLSAGGFSNDTSIRKWLCSYCGGHTYLFFTTEKLSKNQMHELLEEWSERKARTTREHA